MKIIAEIYGVVAEYEGKFWGEQECEQMGFGDLDSAEISKSEFCKKPTDKTSESNHTYFAALSKAKLVNIKKTITSEIVILL